MSDQDVHEQLTTAPAPEKGGPLEAPSLSVGLNRAKDRVVVVVETAGENPVKVEFPFDQEEVGRFCMTLVELGNEIGKPKSPIVIPTNGNMRLPQSRRHQKG